MKRTNTLCVLLLTVMLMPNFVMAQQCTSTPYYYSVALMGAGPVWFQNTFPAIMGTVGSAKVSTCTVMEEPSGPHVCFISSGIVNFASAFVFAAYGPANNVPSLGCRFNCPTAGINCRIQGGDGLPVELMEFSIEE